MASAPHPGPSQMTSVGLSPLRDHSGFRALLVTALTMIAAGGGMAQAPVRPQAQAQPQARTQTPVRVQAGKNYEKQACRPSKYSSRPVCPVVVAPHAGGAPSATVDLADEGKGLTPLGSEFLQIAARVEQGRMTCELGHIVTVRQLAGAPGYFKVSTRQLEFLMAPVISVSGAIRIEDQKAGAFWLQLGHKSMLMSQKLGTRLADECVSPQQAQAAPGLAARDASDLLDGLVHKGAPDGSGIILKVTVPHVAKPQ